MERSESRKGTVFRQTYDDNSPRGDKYLDDRTKLAYVYDGCSLRAILFDEREVRRYQDETAYDVTLTPGGEERMEVLRP